ncbi:FHA domain-containing protein [Mycena sanguinolenta]|uniref:FHA domain-containing protein n=1 Tax=Mycena sanguinolenta TaxID=230812 RepID=A0A8H6YH93_9AGAR|nr:FHA domain-containing protein [Mycena sanguinolenta]
MDVKTCPEERNGYFDLKVMDRRHAEVWEEDGKIFIKDVKSSNGTFVNGKRPSPQGLESEPFELKSDDIVEFGVDVVDEDNKTITHHKVAARVSCIFNEQQARSGRQNQRPSRLVVLQLRPRRTILASLRGPQSHRLCQRAAGSRQRAGLLAPLVNRVT